MRAEAARGSAALGLLSHSKISEAPGSWEHRKGKFAAENRKKGPDRLCSPLPSKAAERAQALPLGHFHCPDGNSAASVCPGEMNALRSSAPENEQVN